MQQIAMGNPEVAEPLYAPRPGERQLTSRSLVAGCLLGGIVSCMNIYMGLKIGWSFGGSLIAAILGFALFLVLGRSLSVLECNITQTSGSAAGTMASAAGLLAAVPAMELLGLRIPLGGLFVWSLSVAYLGVFFAVPLRRQMIEVENLRFPTGTATAETILAMFATAAEAVAKARALLWAGALAGVFTVATYFVPALELPPADLFGIGALAAAGAWGFRLYIGSMLFGAGILIGPRVGSSPRAGSRGGLGHRRALGPRPGVGPGRGDELCGRPAGLAAVAGRRHHGLGERSRRWP